MAKEITVKRTVLRTGIGADYGLICGFTLILVIFGCFSPQASLRQGSINQAPQSEQRSDHAFIATIKSKMPTLLDTDSVPGAAVALIRKEPLAMKLADGVGHVRIATTFGWTLNTGYLVLFMQAGFALLTCGLVRKKNAAHLMMLNFAAFVFVLLGYYAVGYVFQSGAVAVNAASGNIGGVPTLNRFLLGGGSWGILGGRGFLLSGPAYDAGSNVLTLFEFVFMETAGYIIVGAVCERIAFWAFIVAELFIGGILYPVFGCWVWGGGWMSQLGTTWNLGHGYVDFAGSTVVHAVGGFCAMALAVVLGPRLGKHGRDGKPGAFPAHNLVYVVTGTFILLFGWMGFNPGSTLGNRFANLRDRHEYQSGGCSGFGGSHDSVVFHVRQT
jgi:Amt family ammonium transporter